MADVPSEEVVFEYDEDDQEDIEITYLYHPDHRNGNNEKSQWTISEAAECKTFMDAFELDWLDDSQGWGLYRVADSVRHVGVGIERTLDLFIAKFVGNASQSEWHGYPADPTRNGDRPTRETLLMWLEHEFLPSPKISKLIQGKRCKL